MRFSKEEKEEAERIIRHLCEICGHAEEEHEHLVSEIGICCHDPRCDCPCYTKPEPDNQMSAKEWNKEILELVRRGIVWAVDEHGNTLAPKGSKT